MVMVMEDRLLVSSVGNGVEVSPHWGAGGKLDRSQATRTFDPRVESDRLRTSSE